ncbi:MAG TPA: hypothetical protein VF731_07000 [Solirubrobacterales bacterium]
MSRGTVRRSPALIVACAALFVALGGTVYAASRIDGHKIKPKSIPGNRLALGSVPANRLKAGAIPGTSLAPGSVTGVQVDVGTLGQVPSAVHADNADSARDAQTALHAVDAVTATKINGYEAGCKTGTRLYAGACWQVLPSEAAVNAPAAASSCASQGGTLPDPLQLAAFSQQPGVALAAEEWSEDITNVSGVDAYAVITVSSTGQINFITSTNSRKYRCVLPLVG